MTYEAIINDKDEENKDKELLTINFIFVRIRVLFSSPSLLYTKLYCSYEKIPAEYQIDKINNF